MAPTSETCELLARVVDSLDYRALGEIYCDEGGDAFWEARRPAVLELGLAWAAELAPRLAPSGRSLYVGAGVAELPVLLTEVCDLGRVCVVTNLRERECGVLNAALRSADLAEKLVYLANDAADSCAGGFDHVSVVSVLDDPECYPWVSGVTYGTASPLDLDTAAFERERERVRELVGMLLRCLTLPGLVTTTVEEVPWFMAAVRQLGVAARVEEEVVETALVGDVLSFVTVLESLS